MNPNRRKLSDLIALARRAQPSPTPPTDRSDFARQTVGVWKRECTTATEPDLLQLWERAGLWSVATASAIILAVAVLCPAPVPPENPFNIVLHQNEEPPLF